MRPEEMREGYIGWCPHVDAMATGESKGWSSTQDLKAEEFIDQWLPFDPDYNAIVDFFFVRETPARECETCGGSGYNAETQNIADAYYDFEETGNRCGGEGQIPTEPEMLVLNLWMTHPRKGLFLGVMEHGEQRRNTADRE